MRPILLYLLHLIHKCPYYAGQDIEAFAHLMSTDELETYVVARHIVLPPEDRTRLIEVAKLYLVKR